MAFMQLNNINDTPYFCTPKEFAMFAFWLLGFSITEFVIKIRINCFYANLGTNFYYFYYLF